VPIAGAVGVPASVPACEQGVPGALRGDVSVGVQPQVRHHQLPPSAPGPINGHHSENMSRLLESHDLRIKLRLA